MRLPGHRKSVYVEQNPEAGQKAEIVDPAKDRLPAGWRMDGPPKERRRRDTTQEDEFGFDQERYRRREPSMVEERDYYGGDDPDLSPRKVRINPFTEVRLSRVTSLS